jgi:hypothetical protein
VICKLGLIIGRYIEVRVLKYWSHFTYLQPMYKLTLFHSTYISSVKRCEINIFNKICSQKVIPMLGE